MIFQTIQFLLYFGNFVENNGLTIYFAKFFSLFEPNFDYFEPYLQTVLKKRSNFTFPEYFNPLYLQLYWQLSGMNSDRPTVTREIVSVLLQKVAGVLVFFVNQLLYLFFLLQIVRVWTKLKIPTQQLTRGVN
jgi:hypothetical protein